MTRNLTAGTAAAWSQYRPGRVLVYPPFVGFGDPVIAPAGIIIDEAVVDLVTC